MPRRYKKKKKKKLNQFLLDYTLLNYLDIFEIFYIWELVTCLIYYFQIFNKWRSNSPTYFWSAWKCPDCEICEITKDFLYMYTFTSSSFKFSWKMFLPKIVCLFWSFWNILSKPNNYHGIYFQPNSSTNICDLNVKTLSKLNDVPRIYIQHFNICHFVTCMVCFLIYYVKYLF